MARFYLLSPEVAGGLGPHSEVDRRTVPPTVTRLHYVFDGWQGDDLLESYPVFVISSSLGKGLARGGVTGFELADIEIEKSATFETLYPRRDLPPFRWLHVSGTAEDSDIGVDAQARLVVSDRALAILKTGRLDHCLIEELD